MSKNWPKVFRDPVHNLISFDDTPCDRLLLELIDTREVQRLRRIKQMGVTELVFPGANHSRFAHSLGVLHTARLFLDQLTGQHGSSLQQESRAFLLAAALLHDVGHGPFSHGFELVTGRPHETYTREVIRDDSTEVHRCLRRFDPAMPERLALFFDEDADEGRRAGDLPAYLARIVSGQLDADRCDYLLRDSHATGTNYGDFDLAWMIEQLRPDADGRHFYLTRKGLAAVETYLFARYHMYRTVYFHKSSRAAEVMLKLLFRRLAELVEHGTSLPGISRGLAEAFSGRISLATYLDFDDHTVSEMLKACTRLEDGIANRLADGLLNRRLYKALDTTGLPPAKLRAFDIAARELLQSRGYDPRYGLVEDSASDTPYEPYHPDADRPATQIYVENDAGRIVEISAVSEALGLLMKTYTMMRYYVPGEFRDELERLMAGL